MKIILKIFFCIVLLFMGIALSYANGPMTGFRWNMTLRGIGYETGWDQKTADAVGANINLGITLVAIGFACLNLKD